MVRASPGRIRTLAVKAEEARLTRVNARPFCRRGTLLRLPAAYISCPHCNRVILGRRCLAQLFLSERSQYESFLATVYRQIAI